MIIQRVCVNGFLTVDYLEVGEWLKWFWYNKLSFPSITKTNAIIEPGNARLIVTTFIHFHDYLRQHSSNLYAPMELWTTIEKMEKFVMVHGETMERWFHCFPRSENQDDHRLQLRIIWDEISDYFIREGALPRQHSAAPDDCRTVYRENDKLDLDVNEL